MKRINNKFINKTKKGKLLKYGWTLGLGVIPVIASSCGVSSTLIKNSYIVTGDQFTSNLSLSSIATKSLQSTSGMSAYLKSVVDRILYNWLVNLGNNNSEYKTLLDNQRNSINNSYNDSVKSYKKTHGSNWELKFQQEVLDPNGGTKEAYINSQLYSFARSTFTDKLFSTFFLSVYDTSTNSIEVYPSKDDILNALKNTSGVNGTNSNLKFKFDNKVDLTTSADAEPNKSFAAFQDYIYQKYVEYENPYIVDNVQWNYSTPIGSDGINSLYKIPTNSSSGDGDSNSGDSSGDSSSDGSTSSTSSFVTRRSNSTSEITPTADDDSSSGDSGDSDSDSGTTTTVNSGSYAFPYFGNENGTNTSGGTVKKFREFLTKAISKSNFIETSDTDVGLKNIEKSLTDGDSTLKFVKNSTIFNDQSAEYASAVSYLYGVLGKTNGSSNSQLQDISNNIKHNIDLTATTSFDNITSNFISTSSLYTTSSGSSSANISYLKLDKSYISNIIKTTGSLSSVANSDLYVIDNFIPGTVKVDGSTSSNNSTNSLDKFMFFRSSTGVEAASIDGSTLIEKATTVNDKKVKAANVVLYRYFMGNQGHSNFTIDLSSELSTFFSSNIDWLIYQYANDSSQTGIDGTSLGRQTMFELSDISVSDQALAKAISFFTPALTYYNNIYSAAEKMYAAKKTYNQNYGYSVYSNGFASNFNYAYGSIDDAKNNYVNPNIFYENAMLASTASNPYVATSTTKNANTSSSSSGTTTSLYAQVLSTINAVVNAINKQDADYNRYTQYLYSDNYYVNAAMTSVLSNTSYVSAEIQNPVLTSYISNFYSVTSNNNNYNTFNLSSTNPFSSSGNSSITDLQNYLQSALYNFFFLSNYIGETNSLFSFGATTNTKTVSSITTSNNATNLLKNIRDYSWDLWNDKNALDPSTQASNYNTLYRTVASIKYLLGTDLSNFLQYMRSYIGNEKAYVAWQNSTNTNVGALKTTSSYTTPTSQSLVTQENLSINTNNAIYGNYVGKSPYNSSSSGGSNSNATANAYNLETNASYQSSINTSYFSSTSNNLTTMNGSSTNSVNVGFMGLQLSSSNSLPSDVANALFTKPYDYNIGTTGAFYQYTSKENLKAEVSNIITLANLTTLATNLDTVTNSKYNFSGIINTTKSLNEKKADLNAVIDSMSDSDQLFTQFKNYVGVSTSGTTTTINSYSSDATSVAKYGTYAIELKASDFNSLSSLQTALGASSSDTNSYKVADEIICNLVVQYASQASNQTNWISNIVGTNKVDIYDIRAYNAISSDGITWVRNFKTISK